MTSLFVGLALVVAAPVTKEPTKKDAPSVVGKWTVESAIKGGRKDNSPPGSSMELTAEGKMILHENGHDITGSYKTDPKKDPAEIDLTLEDPKGGATVPMVGIFKLDGDNLQMCLAMAGDRPRKLESPEMAPVVLLTLKRTKKD